MCTTLNYCNQIDSNVALTLTVMSTCRIAGSSSRLGKNMQAKHYLKISQYLYIININMPLIELLILLFVIFNYINYIFYKIF